MRILLIIFVSGLIMLTTVPGSTCGPMPVSLFDIVRYSDLIVIAEVSEVAIVGELEIENWNKAKAVLTIQEVLKGNAFEDTVEVAFLEPRGKMSSTLRHARYKTGEKVLTFLSYSPDTQGYRSADPDRGALAIKAEKPPRVETVITPAELEEIELRIGEIQELLEVKDDDERKRLTVDWLVDRAVDPTTRWIDGLYELRGRHGTCFGHERDCDFADYPSLLTEEHRDTLFAALENYPTIGACALTLANLIKDSHPDQLADFMLDRLRSEQKLSNALELAEFIAEVRDDSYLEELAREMREYRSKHWKTTDPEYEQRMIDHFVDSASTQDETTRAIKNPGTVTLPTDLT